LLTLDDFQGCQCYIEIEPASKTDLAAIVLLFPETNDDGTLTYAAFARCDINEAVMAEGQLSWMGCGRRSDRDTRDETDVSALSTGAGFASPSSCPPRVPSNVTALSGMRCAELGKAARRAVSLWHWRPSISVTARRVLPAADDHDGMRLFCCFMHDRR